MDETQHFRLTGTTAVEKIDCDHVDGHNVIYWEDIEQVFPGVKHVKRRDVTVKLLRDSNRKRIIPHCIKHYPGVVLDVVLSSSDENTSVAAGQTRDATTVSAAESVVESLQIAQLSEDTPSNDDRAYTLSRASTLPSMSAHSDFKIRSRASLSFKQIATLARRDSIESEIERQLLSSLPSDLQVRVRTSTNVRESLVQVIKDGLVHQPNEQLVTCLQKLDDKMTENNELASRIMDLVSKNNELASESMQVAYENRELLTRVNELQKDLASKQDEMRQLQIQALDRLALLQKSVKALITQTYELHEYPIPRLFIVLPQDTSSWNPLDLLSNKFRLYFLCECGEHTKSTNSKIPHHIHLAKHEGYDIARPKEFFQQYGSYVLTILQMLKFGITVAGVAIPALSQLVRSDALGQATEGLKLLKDTIEPGMNQVIDYIEKVSADDGQTVVGISEQMEDNEALEGADLRQLESFLKTKDENRVLGNLYRTVTGEGHVKWVCIDHYRENYHEKAAKTFRDTVEGMGGMFDENIGRVELKLLSKVQAEQFYAALEKARSVYELKLDLDWSTTQNDFKKLRNALPRTSVGVLELDVGNWDGPASDILNRNQRYDPIFGIMRHPSIQSCTISGPENFSKRSSLFSRNNDFSNLRHLGISIRQLKDDIQSAKYLVSRAPNISSLALATDKVGYGVRYVQEFYNAIEHRTYPINFKDLNLYIPPPLKGSNQSTAIQKLREDLLDFYCESNSQTLVVDKLNELTVDTIAKATTDGSSLYGLFVSREGQLGDALIENISRIITQTELVNLEIWIREEAERVRILESIQWKHLRRLTIQMKPWTFETRVMDALVYGLKGLSEKVEMKQFTFWSTTIVPLTLPQGDLLQTFVTSLSAIERLDLRVVMTVEQTLSLLRSADLSELMELSLCAGRLDSVQVDAILDGVQHATKLEKLHLFDTRVVTNEQTSRMKAKGITLTQQTMEESLNVNTLDEMTVDTIAKATTNGSTFMDICLNREDQLGDPFIDNISRIVSRSQLKSIEIWTREDGGRVRILKSIQWKDLRYLTIQMEPGTFETDVMKALVDGVKETLGKVEMERFTFWNNAGVPLALPQGNLLQTFVSSLSLEWLQLYVVMTVEQTLSLLRSVDVSRLKELALWAGGFDSAQVDAILDGIPHATKLENWRIYGTRVTNEQISRMRSRGVKLAQHFREDLLNLNTLDELTVDTIAKATTNGSVIKDIFLNREDQLSDPFIDNISSIVSRSELYRIEIWTREDERRVRILESIQWKHLRHLIVQSMPGTFETSVMKTLVDGAKGMSGKVGLRRFTFWTNTMVPLTLPQGDLLQTFVTSLSLEWLYLYVAMTVEQTLSLLKSADLSELKELSLWAGGFDSVQVDAILDGVQHAVKLEKLQLFDTRVVTNEQTSRMMAKGVALCCV